VTHGVVEAGSAAAAGAGAVATEAAETAALGTQVRAGVDKGAQAAGYRIGDWSRGLLRARSHKIYCCFVLLLIHVIVHTRFNNTSIRDLYSEATMRPNPRPAGQGQAVAGGRPPRRVSVRRPAARRLHVRDRPGHPSRGPRVHGQSRPEDAAAAAAGHCQDGAPAAGQRGDPSRGP
jgi:hypothetical protein